MQTKQCQRCGATFPKPQNESQKAWESRRKFCSLECKIGTRINKKCEVCKAIFSVPNWREGAKYCSVLCSRKGSQGKDPTYNALHKWINFHLGTPRKCEHCGATDLDGQRYDWANISGRYKRDLKDWIRLCKKCHRAFDKR